VIINSRYQLQVVHFCGVAIPLIAGFWFIKHPEFSSWVNSYCLFLSKVCFEFLSVFSNDIYLEGNILRLTEYGPGVTVGEECSGLDFMLVAALTTFLFRTSYLNKLLLFFIAVVGVYVINLVRIIVLFITSVSESTYFNLIHSTVAPYMFIVVTIILLYFSYFKLVSKQNVPTQ